MGDDKTQVALCATTDNETRNVTEKALLSAQIAYLMKCERQLEKENRESTVVFYIDRSQIFRAMDAIKNIDKNDLNILYLEER